MLPTRQDLEALLNEASHCTERLGLPLRNQVWRGMAGEFQGAGTGSSIDFQDHRAYVPGDDPRHINWQAFARTGQYSMKLYREEVRPSVDIILDASESMWFDPDKANRCAALLYFSTLSAVQAGANTVIHLLAGDANATLNPDDVTNHLWPDYVKQMAGRHPERALALESLPIRQQTARILISDLLFELDPTHPLRLLSRQQGKAVILVPYLESEVRPDWQGNYEFIDSEQAGEHSHRIEASTLTRYHKAYNEHFTRWYQSCQKFNLPMARISSDTDLLSALNEEALKAGALVTR